LGTPLSHELLKQKSAGLVDRVIVFTRPDSKDSDANKALAEKGVEIVPFDVNTPDVTTKLTGIDVLISTIGMFALAEQLKVITPAKEAGVKLFVPCEWGDNTDGRTGSLFQLKQKVRAESQSAGLPYTAFFHGPWPEYIGHFGLDRTNNKFTVPGEGNAPISFTSYRDVAPFVSHVLVHLPREKLEYAKLAIEGDRISFNEFAADYEKATGKKLEISHTPRSHFEEAAAKPDGAMAGLFLGWDTGKGVVTSTKEELANSLYPEWKPKKVLDVVLGA
jgi:uncharacterized protein YbjT (DUF2867 family)